MRTHLILDMLYKESDGKCYICGLPVPRYKTSEMTDAQWRLLMPSKDHVVPKSAGGGIGKMGLSNIRLTHAKCNSIKGSKPATLFRMEQMFLNKFSMLEGQRLRFHYGKRGELRSITHTET